MLNDVSLYWQIRCIACNWQTQVEALVPFNGADHTSKAHSNDVDGFWEEYICPTHYRTARRMIKLADTSLDIETAYEYYFSGAFSSTPIPTCPLCQEQMHSGQALLALPFYIDAQIEVATWLIQRLSHLHHLTQSELKAVTEGNRSSATVFQTLASEFEITERFYEGICRQFGVSFPLSLLIESLSPHPTEWLTGIDSAIEASQQWLSKLSKRRHEEAEKTAGFCPQCSQQTVYLHRTTTF